MVGVTTFNAGDIEVESGTLNFDAQVTNDGPITINAGATLAMGHKAQINDVNDSITGEGSVFFYNDFWSGDEIVDSMLGVYDVGATIIQAGTVSFDTDGISAPVKSTDTLNLIQGFGATRLQGNADLIVTNQFNWSAGEMAGSGRTLVHGPMILTGSTTLNRMLELNVSPAPSKDPPAWTMFIGPLGTLHAHDVTVDGSVNNSGVIAPGTVNATIGYIHFTGNYTQNADGQLSVDYFNNDWDQLLVNGTATLNGTLNASGFPTAENGDSYTILSADSVEGAFANVNVPEGVQVVYTPTSVILQSPGTPCPADIVVDGIVNVDDLLAVINAWGPCANPQACPADIAPAGPPAGDGAVNVDDLLAVINAWGPCP